MRKRRGKRGGGVRKFKRGGRREKLLRLDIKVPDKMPVFIPPQIIRNRSEIDHDEIHKQQCFSGPKYQQPGNNDDDWFLNNLKKEYSSPKKNLCLRNNQRLHSMQNNGLIDFVKADAI